jgi:hypothetical protein
VFLLDLISCVLVIQPTLVQCVHWLLAQAQKHQWQEELILLKYEMEWTTRFFLHRGRKWQTLLKEIGLEPGPRAYVARQAAQWFTMAADAEHLFVQVNKEYVSIV